MPGIELFPSDSGSYLHSNPHCLASIVALALDSFISLFSRCLIRALDRAALHLMSVHITMKIGEFDSIRFDLESVFTLDGNGRLCRSERALLRKGTQVVTMGRLSLLLF